jgi:phosphoribosylformylglycinamidine synthase
MGERTPLADRAPASGRMAIGEALTNLAAADVGSLDKVKLSANWMAPVRRAGRDARLYATVEGISELCKQIGVSIPVGKDSLSMRTAWERAARRSRCVAAVADRHLRRAVDDVRKTKTPLLATSRVKPICCCSTRQEPPRRLGAGAGL